MMKKPLVLLLFALCTAALDAQVYNELDGSGNIRQYNENGSNGNFNPNRRDSVKENKEVPIGLKAWTIDRRFGDIRPASLDTVSHLYQNTIYNTGIYGQYNTLGTNFTARENRIFADRPEHSEFFFTQPYSFTYKEPDDFLFLNTLSPYTHLTYETCGDKQNGEDHLDAKFAVNVNKRFGVGFDLDYHYALGYYDNQNFSNFRTTLFSSYRGDKYQMHFIGSLYHQKATESGGIVNDLYVTHPESSDEQYTENEIPTVLSHNWNRNNSQHLLFTQRYNLGFYRKVKMSDDEIKARQFARKSAEKKAAKENADTKRPSGRKDGAVAGDGPKGRPDNAKIAGDEPASEQTAEGGNRVKVSSHEMADSLIADKARQDSIDATMKNEYVPVTSFIHTLDINNHSRIYQAYEAPYDYYGKTYYALNDEQAYSADSIYDKNKYLSVKNTFAIALLEGFNKYMKAGLKAFVAHEYRSYQMPDLTGDSIAYYMNKYTSNGLTVGGQITKTQGKTLHFNLYGEVGLSGITAGGIKLDFSTDVNFPLFGDTVQLAAKAFFHRLVPSYFHENYHSKHLWWSHSLDKETRTRIEGIFSYRKTNTRLRVAVEEIQNYTYFGMSYDVDKQSYDRSSLTADVYQESGNINVLTAQLFQTFQLGILNWENVVTYQNSSNKNVLPLPALNVFSNLFLKFKIARVLSVELGGCVTFFTKYEAPDYVPMLNQFAVQRNADSRIELGGYPFVDVYANMHLKRARFFLAMSHVNAGSGSRMQFLTPHYPMNNRILRFGVSWNFFN